MRPCSRCKKILPSTSEYFHRGGTRSDGTKSQCKECRKELTRLQRDTRDYMLRYTYGINQKDFLKLLQEQKGSCKICGRSDTLLCIDHDHTTQKVRGLLCNNCNTGIGMLQDDREILLEAYKYLCNH